MGFVGNKTFVCLIFWLIVLGLILQAIGIFHDSWWDMNVDALFEGGIVYGGLWSICLDDPSSGSTMCFLHGDISGLKAWFIAVRGLGLAGAVVIFLAIISCFVAITRDWKMSSLVTSLLCFLAFLMIAIEWIVFLAKVENEGFSSLDQWESDSPPSQIFEQNADSFEYSINLIVTILADLLCLASGILAIVSWRAKETEVMAA